MRAGSLRHRVTIEQAVATQSASGAETVAWVEYGTVWASLEPLRGREGLVADQPLAEIDTKITIRWSPFLSQIVAKWRIRHQETIYDIKSPIPVNFAQRQIELLCRSGINNG